MAVKIVFNKIITAIGIGIVIIVELVIILKVIQYFTPGYQSNFLASKSEIFNGIYKYGFYAHIIFSPIVLACGLWLLCSYCRNKQIMLHKIIGGIYVFSILIFAAPGGLIMGWHALGGLPSVLSFMILTPLWWFFTFSAFLYFLRFDFIKHGNYMIRSYALTLSAVSLRIYGFIFYYYVNWNPDFEYAFISWLSWVPNLIIAEIFLRFYRNY